MSPSEKSCKRLDLAIIGTRGIPANYGGFETFAEELSVRLASRGHHVTVYGRRHYVEPRTRTYRGVNLVTLPAIRHKYLETVSHTTLAVLASLLKGHDAVLICNGANAFLCWLPALFGKKVVLNVDGIERQRRKWNILGRMAYRFGEFLATQLPHVVVSDARVIQEYYQAEYAFQTHFIPYGAPWQSESTRAVLADLGLAPGSYILYVSRLEPENNAHLVIDAYRKAQLEVPLIVVGDAPYATEYKNSLRETAKGLNVLMPGAIYGTGYRELLSHCLCYVQATEVGGTHPALVEAMGAGALVLANDTPENREVLGRAGLFYRFNDPDSLSVLLRDVVQSPHRYKAYKCKAQERVREYYDWEKIADEYESLFLRLVGEA